MAASSAVVQSAVAAPARRRGSNRWPLYVLAGLLTAFFILPIYLIAVAAISPAADISGFPKALYPRHI
jgi:ABC-type glycerol-3-phosphate transport system permease component